jgi:uncharacterized protein (TIGR03084 family)
MADAEATAALQQVVDDFRTEGAELYTLLRDMDTGYWTQHSSFKNWTLWDVVAHLHLSDHMALTSVSSAVDFRALMQAMRASTSMRGYATEWLRGNNEHPPTGPELLERWHNLLGELCNRLASADPNERFEWAGPGMKARMFATARQMETWAHGWEVYDLMGVTRTHSDRIKNIATIGVRTYGWTFSNRKLPVPDDIPHVALTAPSGAIWTWNDPDTEHYVTGDAVEFCQVVTQTRNIADTQLDVRGDNAIAWMNIAQCFAGPPEDPPAPGTRVTLKVDHD